MHEMRRFAVQIGASRCAFLPWVYRYGGQTVMAAEEQPSAGEAAGAGACHGRRKLRRR